MGTGQVLGSINEIKYFEKEGGGVKGRGIGATSDYKKEHKSKHFTFFYNKKK